MASTNLRKACLDSFAQIAGEDVKNALVYMDAGAGEVFHFLGGLSALLAFGPRAVCSLENASAKDADVRLLPGFQDAVEKVLVITTHLLSYVHHYVHQCLQAHSGIKLFTVLTSVSEEAHAAHPDSRLGTDAFHEYKRWLMEDHRLLLQKETVDCASKAESDIDELRLAGTDYLHEKMMDFQESNIPANVGRQVKNDTEEDLEDPAMSFRVQIKHFSMAICPLTSRTFVFPSNGIHAQAPLAETNSPLGIGFPGIDKIKSGHDDDGMPIGGTLLAHFLHHLGVQLSLKFDVYTLGPLSYEVGKCLTELSGLVDVSVRSKRPAGLLLIDRTLDLVTPSSHSDSVLDRLFSFSSRRKVIHNTKSCKVSPKTVKRHALDVRVPNSAGDLREVGISRFQSKVFDDLLSTYAQGEVSFQLNSQDKLDACKLSNGTLSLLSTMGSSLFDSAVNNENKYLDLLYEKRISDGLLAVETLLQKALSNKKFEESSGEPFSAQKVQDLTKLLSESLVSTVQHADLIQISRAVEMAADPALSSKWEGLSNAEKLLLASVGDSSQSVPSQICDLVYQSIDKANSEMKASEQLEPQKLFFLRDALTLAIVGYALAGQNFNNSFSEGPFSREDEEQLKQAVITAILQGTEEGLGFVEGLEDSLGVYRQQNLSEVSPASAICESMERNEKESNVSFSNEGWEAWDDEDDTDSGKDKSSVGDYERIQLQLQVRDRIELIFGRLHRVSEAMRCLRSNSQEPLFDDYDGFGGSSSARRSLIFKVLLLLFAKAEIPGMEHHASFVGRILKSGFGRFGLRQVKPKLSDNKIIMVFVIGGINGIEVCEAKEAQTIYKIEEDVDFILGGTSFLTPDDMFDLLLGSSILY